MIVAIRDSLWKFGLLCSVTILSMGVSNVFAADHRDAPLILNTPQTDINDLYAFQSPQNPNNTVLIMTANPFAGILSPTNFSTVLVPGLGDSYEFAIDNDGDAREDIVYRIEFVNFSTLQLSYVTRIDVNTPLGQFGMGSLVGVGLTGREFPVGQGGKMVFGVFDDPFFFDANGFNNGFQFTGDDFFAGANVSSIVLEVPSVDLQSGPNATNIGVWARSVNRSFSSSLQIDRVGRPAINTVLIPRALKDAFNEAEPVRDVADFTEVVVETIVSLGRSVADAEALAGILLPDILTLDTSNPNGFLNGRTLEDDVIDIELQVLTGNGGASDGVDANDAPFQPTFPYLGRAWPINP